MRDPIEKWYKDVESWDYSVLRVNEQTMDAVVLGLWEMGNYSGVDLFLAEKVKGTEGWLLSVKDQFATKETLVPPAEMVQIIKQAIRLCERTMRKNTEDELNMIDISKLTDEQKDQMSAEELIALANAKLRRDYGDEVADRIQKRRRERGKQLFKAVGSCTKCGGDIQQFDVLLGTEGLCFECFMEKEERDYEQKGGQ